MLEKKKIILEVFSSIRKSDTEEPSKPTVDY
jgi:hypothetical protein